MKTITLKKPANKKEISILMLDAKDVLDQVVSTWRENIQTLGYSNSLENNYEYDELKEAVKLNKSLKEVTKRFNLLERHINNIINDYNHTLHNGFKPTKTIQEEYAELKEAYFKVDLTQDENFVTTTLQGIIKECKRIEDYAEKHKIAL